MPAIEARGGEMEVGSEFLPSGLRVLSRSIKLQSFGEVGRAGSQEGSRWDELGSLDFHGSLEDLEEMEIFAWEPKSGTIVIRRLVAVDLG